METISGLMQIQLRPASKTDLPTLLPLVARYHDWEAIHQSESQRARAVSSLLEDASLGIIWLIWRGDNVIGYMAVCFCYSIEFGGRDSFLDEFFIDEPYRNQGFGKAALDLALRKLADADVRAFSLEVAKVNLCAQEFYLKCGFHHRDRYSLMTRRL